MCCVSGEVINWTVVSISRKRPIFAYTRGAHANALRFGWLMLGVRFKNSTALF